MCAWLDFATAWGAGIHYGWDYFSIILASLPAAADNVWRKNLELEWKWDFLVIDFCGDFCQFLLTVSLISQYKHIFSILVDFEQ